MTLTPEKAREIGKKGNEAKRKHKDDWWAFLASGGLRQYRDLMTKLSNGEAINKPQEQFMDRSERSFPYIRSRLASVETKTEHSGEIKLTWDD